MKQFGLLNFVLILNNLIWHLIIYDKSLNTIISIFYQIISIFYYLCGNFIYVLNVKSINNYSKDNFKNILNEL